VRVSSPSVTSTRWRSLVERESGPPGRDTMYEGVPAHLEHPLRQWIMEGLAGGGAPGVALRLKIPIDPYRDNSGGVKTLAFDPPPGIELLTVIDAILAMGGPCPARHPDDRSGVYQQREAAHMRGLLARILDEGSSAYQVDPSGTCLTRRALATSASALEEASSAASANRSAGSAATQIHAAWDAIHALQPDPPKAYRAAISAVESAAHAVIEPNNPRATLGTMLGQLRNNPTRYALAIPGPTGKGDITPLIAMIELLWHGQTSRHGGQIPTRDEIREEADMAVQLATTLVHWLTTGAVRRLG
jgi:hypothetical protein